jgi:hypothetical protein
LLITIQALVSVKKNIPRYYIYLGIFFLPEASACGFCVPEHNHRHYISGKNNIPTYYKCPSTRNMIKLRAVNLRSRWCSRNSVYKDINSICAVLFPMDTKF